MLIVVLMRSGFDFGDGGAVVWDGDGACGSGYNIVGIGGKGAAAIVGKR